MEQKEVLVPKLRFSEFNECWIHKPFKELTKINQGLQIPISERLIEQVEGCYFYITNEFLKEGSDKKYYIKNPSESVLCNEDDILMTRTGNTGMVVTNVSGAFHNNFFKIKYPHYINKDFLYYFLTLESTQNYIKRLAGTSTIPDLNHSDFYRIEMRYPSLQEQQKIASFLRAVDSKIQQLERKKELLEQYKKGIMQQLFNQELRFTQDDGSNYPDWEEKKLEQIFNIKAGGDIDKSNVKKVKEGDYKYPIYANSLTNKGLYGYSDVFKIEKECVTVTGRGSLGHAIPRNERFYPIVRLLILLPKKEVDIRFFSHAINILRIYNESTGVPQLTSPQLGKYKVNFPCLEEQTKIANFLSAIDNKIALVNTQITQTQTFKKGLLQQMFV